MKNKYCKIEKDENDIELELAISDALFRIKRDYERTNGNMYLSFSGGKDSTVLAHLIMMCDLEKNIPFVFSDTGIELDAIKIFVDEFPYNNIVKVKPRKPFSKILSDHGKPTISKLKSEALSTYQRHIDEPLKTARARQLITGVREYKGEEVGGRNAYKLANKHMHLIHPDTNIKFANKCCTYLKKYPFSDFEKENNMTGSFSGVRVAEGGARALAYKSCVNITRKNGKEFVQSMPIIDWSDEIVDKFIDKFNIKLSDAYEVYGCTRTGWKTAPNNSNII